MMDANAPLAEPNVMVVARAKTRRPADLVIYSDRIEWRKRINLLLAGHAFTVIPLSAIAQVEVSQKLARDAHLHIASSTGHVTFWFASAKAANQVKDLIDQLIGGR